MCKAVIFGGTTEGRMLYTYCMEHRIPAAVYVATQYGERILDREREEHMRPGGGGLPDTVSVREGRLGPEEMKAAIAGEGAGLVLDATHPYASLATEHIRAACDMLRIPYRRVVREEAEASGCLSFDSIGEAVSFLQERRGSVFVTTGSKDLQEYTALPGYRDRLYVRILPRPDLLAACIALGIEGRHLTAMQGPFSEEMNYAYLKEFDIRWMVTKQSGSVGGFPEKRRAAQRAGAQLLVIRRQEKETGISLREAMHLLEEWK